MGAANQIGANLHFNNTSGLTLSPNTVRESQPATDASLAHRPTAGFANLPVAQLQSNIQAFAEPTPDTQYTFRNARLEEELERFMNKRNTGGEENIEDDDIK